MLILPPWYFANQVDNLTGTPPAAVPGTNFTAAANNADGTAVEVLSALAFDCHYLVVGIGGTGASGINGQCLLDVLVDRAGGTSYGAFIDDLVCGFSAVPVATAGLSIWYHFPVWIPAGSALAVQARSRHTVNVTTGQVVMYAYGNPSRPDAWWCGQKVESLGINAATSQGTDVTPGNTGADGAWTTIGVSTARYGAVQYGVNGSDGSAAALGYYWQIGVGSQRLPGSPTLYFPVDATERGARTGNVQPIWCDVPGGATWQLRATSSGSAEVFNAAVYGVY